MSRPDDRADARPDVGSGPGEPGDERAGPEPRDPAGARPTLDPLFIQDALEGCRPQLVSPGPGMRRAAVTLVLRPTEAEIEALFVKRAEVEGDPWSGHMALPGGHVDRADEDLVETARRETREEVALELDRDAFLGRLDDLHPMSPDLPSIVISAFVAWLDAPAPVIPNHEVQYHRWVPLSALLDPANRSELRFERRGQEHRFTSIMAHGDAIWGLTYQIVINFLEVVHLTEPAR